MAKTKASKQPQIISLRYLCEKADVKHYKVYNNLRGEYSSLSHDEKAKLANTLFDEVTPFLNGLGYYITIARIKDPVPKQK